MMARYAMLLDTHTCIGCLACTVACKVEHGSPPGIWFAPVIEQEVGTYPDVWRLYLPLLCMHCDNPPCVRACPSGAIARRPDGIVRIDAARCCGSRACELACPFGAIRFYARPTYYYGLPTPFEKMKLARMQPGTAQKCDLCTSRIESGRRPACVDVCPTDSRIFGDLDDPHSEISLRLAGELTVVLAGVSFAAPGVRYTTRGLRPSYPHRSSPTPVLPYRPQRIWGLSHAVEYLALGAGGGLHLASLLLRVDTRAWGLSLIRMLALALVVLGGLVLVAHLGRPHRFLLALRNVRGSWLSRGALADFVFIATMAVLSVPAGAAGVLPLATALSASAALLVITYPALAMGSYQAVPAWSGWRLPVEFLVDGLAAGTAVITLLGLQSTGTGAVALLNLAEPGKPWPLALLMAFALIRLVLLVHRTRALASADPGLAAAREGLEAGAGVFDRWGVRAAGIAGTLILGSAALLTDGTAGAWLAALTAFCTLTAAFSGKMVALRIGARPAPESP
ncbi:MAG: 4Fe-4S dicluster domain-containing protein [Armatimonadota bacterium]|nr:4Fe-4S dicluster domain-containing protein [Armatimonadota bacterium]MDR7475736.1 4Fe-4S dicluster domain-containing protein [Armatimonadota bacterium]